MSQPEPTDPLRILAACFSLSAMGGFFSLLRSRRPLTARAAAAATFYSGAMGLVIGLLWFKYWDGAANLYFLVGVSGLAGLGGATLVDFILSVVRQGGVNVRISTGDTPPESVDEPAPSDPPPAARQARSSSINRRRPPK